MKNCKYIVQILRTAGGDEKQRYQVYKVDAPPCESVLNLLKRIRFEHDPSLAFRWSCGNGKCGGCAVMVNKKPVLACREIAGLELVIEPLPGFAVISDLVVHRAPYLCRLEKASNLLGASGVPDSDCLECLCCMGVCPVILRGADAEFAGPAVIQLLGASGVLPEEATGGCSGCGRCRAVCPQGLQNIILKYRNN